MILAFNSKAPYVHKESRWIASLSDGSTVFEDKIPYESSAWIRLREYIKLHNLKITNLRLEHMGIKILLIPYKDDNGIPQINGYWHSNVAIAMFGNGINIQKINRGIGYVQSNKIYITWIDDEGNLFQEQKIYQQDDIAVIINDPV